MGGVSPRIVASGRASRLSVEALSRKADQRSWSLTTFDRQLEVDKIPRNGNDRVVVIGRRTH